MARSTVPNSAGAQSIFLIRASTPWTVNT